MKKIIFYTTLFITCFIAKVNAQTDQMQTNYLFNPLMYNPAYASVNDFMSANLMTRMQWLGSGMANNTYTGTIQSTFPNSDQMGAGLQLQADKYSVYSNYTVKLNYAYKLPVTDYMSLHMGLQGVLDNYNVNYNELTYALSGEAAPNETAFGQNVNRTQMNFGAGLYLISQDRFYLSASVPRILDNDLNKDSDTVTQARFKRSYYLSGGMIFGADGSLPIRPSFLLRYDEQFEKNISYDLNCTFLLSHVLWAGVGVRNLNTVCLIGQLDITDHVRGAFSYDLPLQKGQFSNTFGTFEIGLSVNTGIFANQTVSQRYF